MNALGKFSTLVLLVLVAWAAANWDTIKLVYKYRSQIGTASDAASALQALGVLK